MNAPDGGPAFPGLQYTNGRGCARVVHDPQGGIEHEIYDPGMSLRDYFAVQAMNAMGYTLALYGRDENAMAEVAASAYRAADAMLVHRGARDLVAEAAVALRASVKKLDDIIHDYLTHATQCELHISDARKEAAAAVAKADIAGVKIA